MLARIDAPADPVQKGVTQVAEDNNIAQLNLQVDATSFSFVGDNAGVGLNFDCGNFPTGVAGAQSKLVLDAGSYAEAIANAWQGKAGATVTRTGSEVDVGFSLCIVSLPPVAVPSNTLIPGQVELVLPAGYFGTFTVTLAETINNVQQGGQGFSVTREEGPSIR
jgi:hypothetical protein